MADIIDIDVFQTVSSVSFEVEPNTNIININKVTVNGGAGGSQNLQSVTDIGATTTNPITANSFVKSGGTGINILLDNGTTVALSSIGGNTNLSPTQTSSSFTINSDTGTDATIPLGNGTLAGATLNDFTTAEKNKLSGISGTNTGDQNLQSVTNLGSSTTTPITANSFVKSGGTSSQILAADGSVITQGNNITITGGVISSVGGTGGGGASVNYYLNGGTSQGDFGGTTYYEFSKTAVIGTGADFNRNTNGYIASFITDVADPSLLLIPGGNWNLEFFFSSSSAGGSPSFYAELYKYDGTTFTLIASSSATPEVITNGTAIDAYFTALAVPETVLTVNDRLAIRVYVNASGKTITLHTQNGHLCEVITTFTSGLTALNGLQAQVQNFAVGTSGTDFAINSSGSIHTFNLPNASTTARGAITTGVQTIAGAKTFTGDIIANNLSGTNTGDNATNSQYSGLATSKQNNITLTTTGTSGASTLVGDTLNIPQYSGATDLAYTPSPTNGIVTSSTGNDATIPLADVTNAGLLTPAEKTKISNTSGTNTGDNATNTQYSGLAASKADIASPAFTGNPTAPTQTPLNNSTRLATTAYVEAACAVVAASGGVTVSSQDTFGTANIATVTATQYAAFVTAGTVSSTTLYFITA